MKFSVLMVANLAHQKLQKSKKAREILDANPDAFFVETTTHLLYGSGLSPPDLDRCAIPGSTDHEAVGRLITRSGCCNQLGLVYELLQRASTEPLKKNVLIGGPETHLVAKALRGQLPTDDQPIVITLADPTPDKVLLAAQAAQSPLVNIILGLPVLDVTSGPSEIDRIKAQVQRLRGQGDSRIVLTAPLLMHASALQELEKSQDLAIYPQISLPGSVCP